MPKTSPSAFLVNAQSDPVVLKVVGKASYLNCAPVGKFFDDLMESGHRNFVVDFSECTGMDSTFLGILAASAMELNEIEPPGTLVLCRMSQRIKELIYNVGLHRLLTLDDSDYQPKIEVQDRLGQDEAVTEQLEATSRLVLKAHEALCEIDESNIQKFQDVIAFLKQQVDEH